MEDDTWYFEELQCIHALITQELRQGARYDAIQLAVLFHLGQKIMRLMDTAPRARAPGAVS
jgi:hypothetical protein